MIFNKVKKEVILLKDVKIADQPKFTYDTLSLKIWNGTDEEFVEIDEGVLVQFSNREEWDLGKGPSYSGYVHFYTEGKDDKLNFQDMPYDDQAEGRETVYNRDWTMLPTLPGNYSTHNNKYHGSSRYGDQPCVKDCCEDPLTTYDVAQIISNDKKYVGWHAFWPSLSDWSASAGTVNTQNPDRGNLWQTAIWFQDRHDIDGKNLVEPFQSPLVVGEWDFVLTGNRTDIVTPSGVLVRADRQFRGVSVYGVTDYKDASDDQFDGTNYEYTQNKLENETMYQLDEIFMPWDLKKAVHKETKTWVEWDLVSGGTYTTLHRPVIEVSDADWDQYCTFSERVYDLTDDALEVRPTEYTVTYNNNGTMTISGLDSGHDYKIVYDTLPQVDSSNEDDGHPIEIYFDEDGWISESWIDNLGANHTVEVDVDVGTPTWSGVEPPDNATGNLDTLWFKEYDFKVYREDEYEGKPDEYIQNVTLYDHQDQVVGWVEVEVQVKWYLTASQDLSVTWPLDGETLHVMKLKHKVSVDLNYSELDWDKNFTVKVWYEEMLGGRWEWTVVGRGSHAVDSIGASLVTAAFKNKQVEIGMAGLDMMFEEAGTELSVPYVMRKFDADPPPTGWPAWYKDTPTATNDPGKRPAIVDDWCTTWQASRSNMIGVGGILANVFTQYFNEFTEGFYALHRDVPEPDREMYTPYEPWRNEIVALTCWNKSEAANHYDVDADTGYAVIGTYKDINGTVGLLIWGIRARDTFYASKFFHDELIYELQQCWSTGVTSIILEIDYSDPKHPTFDIVEVLGTISERGTIPGTPNEYLGWTETWLARKYLHDYYSWGYSSSDTDAYTIDKGGIHDP
jgi:hypothetical protein